MPSVSNRTIAAVTISAAIVFVGLGGAGVYAWDRHKPIGFTIPVPFWHPRFALPDSLATQLAAARQASREAASAVEACTRTLVDQSGYIARYSQASQAALAAGDRALLAKAAEVTDLRKRAATLRIFVPEGADRCARYESADEAVLRALR